MTAGWTRATADDDVVGSVRLVRGIDVGTASRRCKSEFLAVAHDIGMTVDGGTATSWWPGADRPSARDIAQSPETLTTAGTPMTELTESRNFDVYVEGFDAGFGQKWADLVPAFRDLPEGARVLDVGSGSGTLLRHLSAGQPHLELFAVEPSATLRATTGQACPDVHVVDGDATALPYDDASMDVVVLSSVLHEVFSYNGYDHGAVRAALREAARALRPGGRLAVRDGVRPDDADRLVTMALLTDHAVEWFERFRVDFRPSHPQPGIVAEDVMAGRMVRLSLGDAAEFLSKKDYQANWDAEVQEQFGVFTKGEWAGEVSAAGFGTVDACSYLHPWVARHRYEGEVVLVDAPVLFPPTTVAIHATK